MKKYPNVNTHLLIVSTNLRARMYVKLYVCLLHGGCIIQYEVEALQLDENDS